MSTAYVLLVTGANRDKLIPHDALSDDEKVAKAHGGFVARLKVGDPEVDAAMALFKPADLASHGGNDGHMYFCTPTQVDGGNGGGGGDGSSAAKELRVRQGFHKRSYWNFRACPPNNEPDTARFPPLLRFEACLHFRNFDRAYDFLNTRPAGSNRTRQQILGAVFDFVQLVAVTEQA